MNPTIKARIESIRRGEVPEGYKWTKIGIVPNEWGNVLFSTLFESFSVYTEDLEKYPLYSLTIEEGITPKTERYERSFLVKKKNAYKVMRPNDFAYNPMNLRFGAVARYKGEKLISVSGYYDIFTTKSKLDLEFMDNFLIFDNMITYYNKVSIGSLIEKQRVHFSNFLNFELPLPPLTERNRIAEILAGQDRVIALKEKLLAEKQKQKKYLMQQLLTAKKRLPGFSGEWKRVKLSEIATPIKRKVDNKYYEVLSITAGVGFVNQAEKFGKEIAGEQYNHYTLLFKTEFSYNKGNSKKYPQGCIFPLEDREKAAVPNVFISFGLNPCLCWFKFYKFLFESGALNKQLFRVINSGVRNDGLLNINSDDFFNCMILVPEYNEQTAIAEILSTADKEIELLKKDIEQEKLKKKSLMQLLLTGIVRVDELVS